MAEVTSNCTPNTELRFPWWSQHCIGDKSPATCTSSTMVKRFVLCLYSLSQFSHTKFMYAPQLQVRQTSSRTGCGRGAGAGSSLSQSDRDTHSLTHPCTQACSHSYESWSQRSTLTPWLTAHPMLTSHSADMWWFDSWGWDWQEVELPGEASQTSLVL